jgi:hypothetical protein
MLTLDFLLLFTQSVPGTITVIGIASAEAFGTAHLTDSGVGLPSPGTTVFGGSSPRPVHGSPARSTIFIRGDGRRGIR